MWISRVVGGQSGRDVRGISGCSVKPRSLLGVRSKETVEGTSLRHCLCISYNWVLTVRRASKCWSSPTSETIDVIKRAKSA